MNKKSLLSIGILIVLGTLWYALQQPNNTAIQQQDEQVTAQQEGDIAITGETTEVWYSAQKKFFSRPTETIEGRNTNIIGFARTVNERMLSGEVRIAHDGFVSSSSQRDSDVAKLLGAPIKATFADIQLEPFMSNQANAQVPVQITINGVTQEVIFTVTSEKENTTLTLQGAGEVELADFDIEPPSLFNIYEVDNLLGLGFTTTLSLD